MKNYMRYMATYLAVYSLFLMGEVFRALGGFDRLGWWGLLASVPSWLVCSWATKHIVEGGAE